MKRLLMPLTLLAVVALIVAGCGGGGGGSISGGGGITVAISPTSRSLAPGGACTFSAVVSGASDPSVTWTATGGNISYGSYVAPSNSGTYYVHAWSNEDQTKKATATVTVSSGGGGDNPDDPNKPPDPPEL